jgi:hypothetical protein
MSEYYTAQRTRNLFDPLDPEPSRCFYFDCRLSVSRFPDFPFVLKSAVDALLKKEVDIHRANGIKRYDQAR